ncbi:MAG TPA: CBS domain-containing protein, partial [Polyangiaceae bacterium]|nr:CBS domain-containing protein [Polyangiaceae bacterium]
MSPFDLPVAHFMTSPVHTLPATARLLTAARRMDELDVSALPVVDGGRLLGMLDRADLIHHGRLRRRPVEGESRWWWPDLSVLECMQTSV